MTYLERQRVKNNIWRLRQGQSLDYGDGRRLCLDDGNLFVAFDGATYHCRSIRKILFMLAADRRTK